MKPSCIIVGGGPAGISTALFLASVAPELAGGIVVLEKERYPREKYCAGAMGLRAERALAGIGVTVDVPSVPIRGLAIRVGEETRVVRSPGVSGRVVRRLEFDAAFAAVARRRGIDVREGVSVTGVEVRPGSVRVHTSQGELDGDAVVGADGVASVVRRSLRVAPTLYVAQALEVDTEPAPGDLGRDVLAFDLSRRELRGYVWHFPTIVDGEPLVCRGVYAVSLRDGRRGPEVKEVLESELSARGLSLSSYGKKRYAERGFHPRGEVSRPRVLLVGEAAGIDPITGEGIAQAIQYGAAAGHYLARKLRTNDVTFEDWPSAIRRHSVGRDLIVRESVLRLAYGPSRPTVERFLLDSPEFMRVGLHHFAGDVWPKRSVARAASAVLHATTKALLSRNGPST